MRLSIIIPTYNHAMDCLLPCLNSLIQFNDLADSEIIVVANGCTDGTEELVHSLGHKFIRVISFDRPLGVTRALNEGFKEATGEFVLCMNNDTQFLPQARNIILDQMFRVFDDPNMALVGLRQLHDKHTGREFILTFCAMYRRSIIEEIGLFDNFIGLGPGEDVSIAARIQDSGYKIAQIGTRDEVMNGGSMPFYHVSGVTMATMPNNDYRTVRNSAILRNRYRRRIRTSIVINAPSDAVALRRCIRSVWEHTDYSDVEIIVMVDPSYADCIAYLEQICHFGPYIAIQTTDTRAAIDRANGDYIVFLAGNAVLLDQARGKWLDMLQQPILDDDLVVCTSPAVVGAEAQLFCTMFIKDVLNHLGGLRPELWQVIINRGLRVAQAGLGNYPIYFGG